MRCSALRPCKPKAERSPLINCNCLSAVTRASARTVEQVEEIVQVVELSVEEVEKLNAISA